MEGINLDAQLRKELGRAQVQDLREAGFIPAVIYGLGKEALSIKVSRHQLLQLLHQHRLENAIISLQITDGKQKKPAPCLIKEIQHDPVKGEIKHVDFNEISLTKAIRVNVPVAAKGEPAGVKQEGGSLEHILWEVEVECLPTEIPQEIAIDVSQLKLGDAIHIKDIKFPPGVKVIDNPEAIVLSVAAPMKEEVPVAAEGEEKAEPEVIKEKKEAPAEEEQEPQKEKK